MDNDKRDALIIKILSTKQGKEALAKAMQLPIRNISRIEKAGHILTYLYLPYWCKNCGTLEKEEYYDLSCEETMMRKALE